MKKILAVLLLCAIIAIAYIPSFALTTYYMDKFTGAAGSVEVPVSEPCIDAEIKTDEGWSDILNINENNYIPSYDWHSDESPSADVRFAYAKNGLCLACDIIDPTFTYTTGRDDFSYGINTYGEEKDFYGWNGDVFIFTIDPDCVLLNSGLTLSSDYQAWLCFGMLENGDVVVRRTRFGEADLSEMISTKGSVTENGWRFEAMIPWDIIESLVDLTSFGIAKMDKAQIMKSGTLSRACIIFMDRYYDHMARVIGTINRLATLRFNSVEGLYCPSFSPNPVIGSYGIDMYTSALPQKENKDPLAVSFSDINGGSWYYDAVSYTVRKQLFNGTGNDMFSPDMTLTRAMFVTLLQRLSSAEGKADCSVYNDVPENQWYTGAVNWASENALVMGVGGNRFAPDRALTRQEAVTLLYRYISEYENCNVNYASLSYFEDEELLSEWGRDAFSWAVDSGVIKGIEINGQKYLKPSKTATRAEAAQILKNYINIDKEYFTAKKESITLCGTDISEYKIVCSETELENGNILKDYIEKTSGDSLEIVIDDETQEAPFEILIGDTNRSSSATYPKGNYGYFVEGSKLYLSGNTQNGTAMSVYAFLRRELGWIFPYKDIEKRTASDLIIEETTKYEISVIDFLDTDLMSDEMCIKNGIYTENSDHEAGRNTVALYNGGTFSDTGNFNPCYSDDELILRVKNSLLSSMDRNEHINVFFLTQNDNVYFCLCDDCQAACRRQKSRAGAFLEMTNIIAQEAEQKHPENKLVVYSCDMTAEPTETPYNDNVMICARLKNRCFSHALCDRSCSLNTTLYRQLEEWKDKCAGFYFAEHIGAGEYYMSPVTILDSLYEDFNYFHRMGIKGYFTFDDNYVCADFIELYSYLRISLLADPDMTKEEYNRHIRLFMSAYYGSAAQSMTDYIETLELLQNEVHFSQKAAANAMMPSEYFKEHIGLLYSYFDEAYQKVSEKEYTDRIDNHIMTLDFNKLIFCRELMEENEYIQANEAFYNAVRERRYLWSHRSNNMVAVDYTRSPLFWI